MPRGTVGPRGGAARRIGRWEAPGRTRAIRLVPCGLVPGPAAQAAKMQGAPFEECSRIRVMEPAWFEAAERRFGGEALTDAEP